MRAWIFVLFAFLGSTGWSQDITYARDILDKLTSPGMHGRGYYKKGDKKAARFIKREFRKNGIHAFEGNYFQKFDLPINTIRGRVELTINNRKLDPGQDFLIAAFSPGMHRTFTPLWLTGDSLDAASAEHLHEKYDLSERIIITGSHHKKLTRGNYLNAHAIILKDEEEPLWWHVSNGREQADHVVIDLKKDALPEGGVESVEVRYRSRYIEKYRTQNVIGFIKGHAEPDSFLVFTAHYDHLGRMGKETYFPGANDNASGTAMVMDLARFFGEPGNAPAYSVAFMLFAGEEAGLEGSRYCADNPPFPLSRIKFLINLDMIGTGSEGITVVNGTVFKKAFGCLQRINKDKGYLAEVKVRDESCNSDHCPFYQKGVPSVFIYTRGKEYSEYHTITDMAEDLPLTGYEDLFGLLVDFVHSFAEGCKK